MPRLEALPKQAEFATFKDELIFHARHSPGWNETTAKSFCYLIFISESNSLTIPTRVLLCRDVSFFLNKW